MVKDVQQLWNKHEEAAVPSGFRGVVVDGINLTVLHCEIAANILTYIQTGGRLGPHRVHSLREKQKTLEKSLELLNGSSREYFTNLKKISDLVIRAT